MSDELTRHLMGRLDTMKGIRAPWDSHYQEIAERILPRHAEFTGARAEGEKRTDKIYEARPSVALERFGSAMDAMLTPAGSRWHKITADTPALLDDHETLELFDVYTDLLFKARYSPRANFAHQNSERWMSLGAFGTGVFFVGESEDNLPYYVACPLSQCYIAVNHRGFIDTLFREFKMTARAIRQAWPEEAERFPDQIKTAIREKPEDKFQVLHACFPREERDRTKKDRRNMPWASIYLTLDPEFVLHDGGEHEFPYMVSRYVTAPNEIYGRGPAMVALPDIKMINEMSKQSIIATHMRSQPPILAYRDGLLRKVQWRPGALVRGGINKEGRQLVQPAQTGADPQVSEIGIERRLQTIDDMFLVNLMRTLQDHPNMTATQALMLAQERGVIMGPTIGRQQSEALGPQIERELAILERGGHLPPPTQALLDARGEYRIEYDSPINRSARAEDGLAITRTLEQILPLGQVTQEALDHFDWDEIARLLPDIHGAPAKILLSLEEVAERREAREQAQQQAQMAAAAPGLAKAAKDGAEAQQIITQGGENGQPALEFEPEQGGGEALPL